MNSSYDSFRDKYDSLQSAQHYRDRRFTRSKRWRWIDQQEQRIIGEFLRSLAKGSTALDMPCGAGRLVPLFADVGVGYAGADASEPMIKVLKETHGDEMNAIVGDARSLPYDDNAFAAVVCIRLMHRITEQENRSAILREMARVSSGPLLVSYYCRGNLRGLLMSLKGKYAGVTPAEVQQDAAAAGLRVTRQIALGRWTQQEWFFEMAAG